MALKVKISNPSFSEQAVETSIYKLLALYSMYDPGAYLRPKLSYHVCTFPLHEIIQELKAAIPIIMAASKPF